MSTRCQIIVQGSGVQIYRHSDGYPDAMDGKRYAVLPVLVPYVNRFLNERGWHESYLSARILAYLIRDHELQDSFLGYGIEPSGEFHGDENYIYVINHKRIDVYEPQAPFYQEPVLDNCKRIQSVKLGK